MSISLFEKSGRAAARLLDRLQPSSSVTLFIAAIIVGVGTGFGAVFFIWLIDKVEQLLFGTVPQLAPLGRLWLLFIPAIGGLVAGPIIAFFASEAKGHGVPEVMQAIALRGGRIRPRVVVAKVLASASCIGSGGSAGREGPIVQVGAALGSTLAQLLRFSEERIRNLVACGAAAGIAATFNAPIAGVAFALEIILGELAIEGLSSVVLSAVMASTVARAILGDRPAFTIPLYTVKSHWEILLYLLLGVLGAVIGVLFIKTLYWAEDVFDEWEFPAALKPAVGGVLLGALALLYPLALSKVISPEEAGLGLPLISNIPHVMGAGFHTIEASLLGKAAVLLMLVLIFLKMLATALTLGSGNSGGVFAPGLFMGAMTGGVFGWVAQQLLPNVAAGPGPYATVGMAAVFSAAARAPLTAILIVFEMTDDYRILLPLMAAVGIGTVVAQKIHPESIYTLKLVKKGIHLFRGRDMDVMSAVRVAEAMDPNPITVAPTISVRDLEALFLQTNSHGFPVVNEAGELCGIVSLEDFRRVSGEDGVPEHLTVDDIATHDVITVFPDEPLRVALQRMAPRDLSRLPVVSRNNPKKLIGVLRRRNIIRAYEIGLMRRGFALGNLPGSPLGTASGKFLVGHNSPLIGKSLADLNLPDTFLVIHIERNGNPILPHGDTVLQENDELTILACDGDLEQLEKLWQQLASQQTETQSQT
ncbi:MAG: CBS domain-containing protein [Anaerolineae bacterium]|nr:MAG: CBS domain-containing protein [Anaerolineae bacterium]